MPDAPSTAGQAPADALAWMNDDANWKHDSPAARELFHDIDDPKPGAAVPTTPIGTSDGLADATNSDTTARDELAELLETESAVGEAGYSQDEHGKWHRPDGAFADAKEIEAIEAVLAEQAAPPAGKSSGPAPASAGAAPETATGKSKQPIGDVVVYGADGKPLEALPALAVTYAANGKTLEKVPLDKLIRKAQLGEYNEQREQDSLAARQAAEQARAQLADLTAHNQQYAAFFERVLADDAFYQTAKASFAAQHTPEALLAAKDAEIAAIHRQQQESQTRAQSEAFVAQHIAPRITGLAQSLPQDDVTQKAFYGQIALLTAPLLVNGKVPPQRLPEVVRIIDTVLTPWAEQIVQSRAATDDREKATLRRQVEAAKVALTLAKKREARVIAPQGRPGPTRDTPAAPPPPRSAEEANERFFAQLDKRYAGTR